MRTILIGLSLVAGATAAGAATPPVPVANPAPEAVPEPASSAVALGTDRVERMTVPVSIAGIDGIRFVVDTGAERTVVSRQLADRLGLATGPMRRLVSVTGTDTVSTVIVPTLELSGSPVSGIEAPALDAAHIGASGLLGLDSLQSRRVLLDFRRNQMTISPARKRDERWDDDTIVVRAKSRYGQLILVDSSIGGQRIQVIIDTGAETSIGNMALLKKLAGRRRAPPLQPVTITSVTGQTIVGQYTQIPEIRIGGVTLNNLPVAFTDAEPFRRFGLASRPALLLGMDALRLFERVSVDFANRQVKFLPPDMSMSEPRLLLAWR